jgi:hypothetical protein
MASGGPADLFKQIEKMQAEMHAAQEALASTTVDGTAGGGVVRATVSGDGELRAISIDPGVVDPADVETLEDLVVAAVHEAMRRARELRAERLGAATGGLDLDAMLGGLGGPGGLGGLGGLLGPGPGNDRPQ